MTTEKLGDFTGLGQDYANYRPDYSPSVLKALLGLLDKPSGEIDFVDVGAGTGIWTRMVANAGAKTAIAIEPNDDMRENGIASCQKEGGRASKIKWLKGSAEATTLADNSADFLTMASSFHWADFDKATSEFHRVLRPNGRFCALWNPRLIEINPMLVEIENRLKELKGEEIKRVSSGRSGVTETLTERLWASPYFDDVVYIEGRHTIYMSHERYLGAWRSVNDLRVQLGAAKFDEFLRFVEKRVAETDAIEAVYLTRAWSAKRKER